MVFETLYLALHTSGIDPSELVERPRNVFGSQQRYVDALRSCHSFKMKQDQIAARVAQGKNLQCNWGMAAEVLSRKCKVCGRSRCRACKACGGVWYCSDACQREDRAQHK